MRRQRQQRPRTNRDSSPSQASSASLSSSSSSKIFIQHGIDLNTNIGEGFGHYKIEGESDILPFVTSANIACGAHAGDPVLMEAALEEVSFHGHALGAHIGYPDLAGFGRREIHLSPAELRTTVLYQLGALTGMAHTLGYEITQVRPHGFLYRQLSHDVRIATIVAKAISEFDRWLVLIGPACNSLLQAGERAGIRVAGEAWVDRTYDATGSLLPHNHPRAIIKNPQEILKQAANLIRNGEVVASDGTRVQLDYQTIHLHCGMAQAKTMAEEIRKMIPNACPLTSEPFTLEHQQEYSPLAYPM